MKNYKRILSIAVVILILASVWLVYRSDDSRTNKNLKQVNVSQAFQHLLYIGLYVAQDKGFFESEGLDININTAGGDAQAFSALTSGSADFAQGDPAFVAIAKEQGWNGKVIAMAVDRVAIWGVTFSDTIQPFVDPSKFEGKTVATYPDPNTSYVVQKQLALKAGLNLEEDVKILQVPFGTELSTLQNDLADIAQTIEPNVTQVEMQGGKVVFSYPDAWGPLAFTGVMVSQRMIDDDPETVQKFVNAYEKAFNYISTDFEGTVLIAKQYLPNLEEKVIRIALKRLINSSCIPKSTEVNPISWEKLLQIRIEVGDLKAMPSEVLYDNTFSEKAKNKKNGG
ncbi:MAG: ABC transporter substrate-binding protein [Allomuricauda sp.]